MKLFSIVKHGSQLLMTILLVGCATAPTSTNYFSHARFTVIDSNEYQQTTAQSDAEIANLTAQLGSQINNSDYTTMVIQSAVQTFADRPYRITGYQGEGNWCPINYTQHTCAHIRQDPIYRTNSFVCNSFVQTTLALVGAQNLAQYQKNILSINYGAAGEPPSHIHFYNRNNFISADFNPVNERNGLLKDATGVGNFAHEVHYTSAVINRRGWFRTQGSGEFSRGDVRVLNSADGLAMAERLANNYPDSYHFFKPEQVRIDYLPKEIFVYKAAQRDHTIYLPRTDLINQLPTPSVIEFIQNDHTWFEGGVPIEVAIHSGINVSHLGFLYRQNFANQQLIYRAIHCMHQANGRTCTVTPVYCQQPQGCSIVMLAHATDSYPKGFYYYTDSQGNYYCTARHPMFGNYTTCNRVVAIPFADYLLMNQYGHYRYLDRRSFLGIHLEQIQNVQIWRKFF